MTDLEKSVLNSLDGKDSEILPFLPYILQDLYELGADPKAAFKIIENNIPGKELKAIDIGCGKGAVSIKLAENLGYDIFGIDGVPEFVKYAEEVAASKGLSKKCRYIIGDARILIAKEKDYDLAMLGSVGNIFGDFKKTLLAVSNCVKSGGYILLDDAFIEDEDLYKNSIYLKRTQFYEIISECQLAIIDQVIIDKEEIESSDSQIFKDIVKRINELKLNHPEMSNIFDNYIISQAEENEALENNLTCVLVLLKKAV